MSVSMTNLFNYARSLPEPFDTLPGKKVKVSSKYSHGTEATLCASVIKTVNAACCMNSGGEGAIGTVGEHKYAAEYKSFAGPDTFHIVVYESVSGNIVASVYDRSTEVMEQYTAHPSRYDGAALFLAMLPALMEDEEFAENYRAYSYQLKAGFPDMDKAVNAAAMFCDNAYRRIKDDSCPAHVKVNIDKSGNLMRISRTQLDSGAFTPTSVIAGEFTIFARTGHSDIKAAGPVIDHADFVGKYVLDETRTLSAFERSLVPELPEWYIIPPEVVSICRHAQDTSGKAMPMRNFLLRGPAGTGKTMGAKAIAAGLGLPYMKYTCSAGTEIFDFVGMVFPQTDKDVTADAPSELNYAGISKLLNLPDLDDMDYDPEGVFKSLTGMDNPHATTQDCMAVVLDMVTSKAFELSSKREGTQNSGQTYTYVETDFIKALKYGYVVEIQEPSTIMQPGVLVGLNSLLEQGGSITLPTGEVIRRHPDAVVIVTTNVSYEGCRAMNQSVTDRMSLIEDIELPEPDVMLQRAMAVTGCEDEYLVARMVQVVFDITAYCRRNGITDGSSGMRGLIDWITSTEISGDPYRSALCTVISRAAPDEEDREALISAVLEPIFAPGRRKR